MKFHQINFIDRHSFSCMYYIISFYLNTLKFERKKKNCSTYEIKETFLTDSTFSTHLQNDNYRINFAISLDISTRNFFFFFSLGGEEGGKAQKKSIIKCKNCRYLLCFQSLFIVVAISAYYFFCFNE